jgi:hypothetical protein
LISCAPVLAAAHSSYISAAREGAQFHQGSVNLCDFDLPTAPPDPKNTVRKPVGRWLIRGYIWSMAVWKTGLMDFLE